MSEQGRINESFEQAVGLMLDGMPGLVEQIGETTGSGVSSGGEVRITMAADGTVKDVEIPMSGLSAEQKQKLRTAIREAANKAAFNLRSKQSEITKNYLAPVEGAKLPVDLLRDANPEAYEKAGAALEKIRQAEGQPVPKPKERAAPEAFEPEHAAEWLYRR